MDKEEVVGTLVVVFVFLVLIGGWLIQSKVEKDTYNRLTGSDVTFVEALFTNIRVDCNDSNQIK